MTKIAVIIPCFNVAFTIKDIIQEIKRQGLDAIIIDDGSIDKTAEVSTEASAVVLKHKLNMGKGASLRRGFSYALSNNYDAAITMDGDGQHSTLDIASFISILSKDGSADIIVGNRMLRPFGMPFVRYATNKVMSAIISRICQQHIPDSQCGFRLIKTECLKKLKLMSNRFEIESEILIEAARNGFKISSIPIRSIYKNTVSRINPFFDTLRFIKFIFLSITHCK